MKIIPRTDPAAIARACRPDPRFWHGGVPGLQRGELIEPGHARQHHEGCAWCEARAAGGAYLGMDGPSRHPEHVYATTDRLYARFHASLWGYGDLYHVRPVGPTWRSDEDSIESYRAQAWEVVAVVDRAVRLTMSERRRLWKLWGDADGRDLLA